MDRKKYLAPLYSDEDKKLIRFFQQELNKINLLYVQAINSRNGEKANQLIGKLREIEKVLNNEYSERADLVIPREYLKGMSYINDAALGGETLSYVLGASAKEIKQSISSFGPAHIDAVNALLNTSKNYVKSSLDGMQRQAITMINEIQQEKVREQLAGGFLAGESLQGMKDRVKQYFFENKITVFKDRAGREWSMDRYVDMLTRTETNIANVQGTINRAIQLGITKFKIVESPDCCEYCSEYNGEIVDIKDGSVDLPPYHPNCRGYIIAVVDDIEQEENTADVNDNIQEGRAMTPEERKKKALDVIENSTMYLKHEQAALINEKGEIIRMASGKTGEVTIPSRGIYEPFTLTHNHPNSSSFSWQDLKLWLNNDYEYGIRASSKVGTYSLYSDDKWGKYAFIEQFKQREGLARIKAKNDMSQFAVARKSGNPAKDFIKFKDGTILYYKDDPLKIDKIFDEHYRKYLREAMVESAEKVKSVKFEFIPNDGLQKNTDLNKMYLNKVAELNKLRRSKVKMYEDFESININNFI